MSSNWRGTVIGAFFILYTLVGNHSIADHSKVFRDSRNTVKINLPVNWNMVIHEDEGSLQMFIAEGAQIFESGIIITRIENVVEHFNLKSSKDVVPFWENRMNGAARQYYSSEVLKIEKLEVGSYVGVKQELRYKYESHSDTVHLFQVILNNKGTMFTLIAIAPEGEWMQLNDIYLKAIASLQLN